MSIPLESRIRLRKEAPFHVQLELTSNSEEIPEMGDARVDGRVVRVFRSDGRLAPGDSVAFKLWMCRRGKEPTGPAYVYRGDFIQASHMEVYLCGSPPKLGLAAYEFTLLNAPSDKPNMSVGQLEELKRQGQT